jgi:hypothetical protein
LGRSRKAAVDVVADDCDEVVAGEVLGGLNAMFEKSSRDAPAARSANDPARFAGDSHAN